MTLADFKKMFIVGSEWVAENSSNPRANGERVMVAVFAAQFQWRDNNGTGGFTYWPSKAQILEARDGFVRFQVHKASQCDPRQNNWSPSDTLSLTCM